MKEFNLEKALAGHPVITGDGREVNYIRKIDEVTNGPNLIGVISGRIQTWHQNGRFVDEGHMEYDLFMKVVKKPFTIITANDRYNFLSSKLFAEDDTYELLLVIKRWKELGYTDIQTHVIEREE